MGEIWENQKPVLITTSSEKQQVKNQKPVLVVFEGGYGPQITRLLYPDDTKGAPSDEKVRQFVIESGYPDDKQWGQILVVIKSTKIIWTYVQVSAEPARFEWVGGGTDIVSPFNNTRQGTIIGDTHDGYVEHLADDSDGMGHVHGFEKKLDKADVASVVYANDSAKTPTTVTYDINPTAKSIVQRDPNGRIYADSATSDSHVVNLAQANNLYVHKSTSTDQITAYTRINGVETNLNISKDANADTIAQRGNNGVLKVGTPTVDTDATTKKYVDDSVATEKTRAETEEAKKVNKQTTTDDKKYAYSFNKDNSEDKVDITHFVTTPSEINNILTLPNIDGSKIEVDLAKVKVYLKTGEVSVDGRSFIVTKQDDTNVTFTPKVDTAITDTGIDPVQGKVVKAYIDAADTALGNRIATLEGRAHYLGGWDTVTGKSSDLGAGYAYQIGDYYVIVNCDVPSDYPEYDSSKNYVKNDKCSHENKFYICKEATTGAFDPTKWDEHTIKNYRPQGIESKSESSTEAELNEIALNDFYRYAGAGTWILYHFSDGKVKDVQVNGTSIVDNKGVANIDLNSKLDKVTSITAKEQMYVKHADGTQGMADIPEGAAIDTAMSDTSVNAVQNKVIKKYVDDNKFEPKYIELNGNDGSTGTLDDGQITILKASELNYIWLNGMHRLDFRYRDNANNKATYSMGDLSSDGIKHHSVEINLTTKGYKVYHKNAIEEAKTTDDNTYAYGYDKDGQIPVNITAIGDAINAKLTKVTTTSTNDQMYVKKADGTNELRDITTGSVEIDDASIVKDADGKLKVSYGGKYKQEESTYYINNQSTQIDTTFKNTLEPVAFDPTHPLVADQTYNYDVEFGGEHFTGTAIAYTKNDITLIKEDSSTQTTTGIVIEVVVSGLNVIAGTIAYPETGDQLARLVFSSKDYAAAASGAIVSVYSGGAESIETINGKVIPVDNTTIKLNSDGKLEVIGGGSSVEFDGVSIIKDETTQKYKTAIGGGTSGGTSQTLLNGIQIDEVVSPTNVRISSKSAAEVNEFTVDDVISGVFSLKGVDYDFNATATASTTTEGAEIVMATISAENFKLLCSSKGSTKELFVISETTDLEKATDMNVTASVGGSSIQYIDNQYLNIDSETLEVTTEGKLKVKGGTGGGYEPDGSSIIKNSDDKLAVSYGGKYVETSHSLFIGIHDTGAGVSSNIRYVESVDTPEVTTFEQGDYIEGHITITGEGSVPFRAKADTITIENLDTGNPFEFLGIKIFSESASYGNIHLGIHEGQFVLTVDIGESSTLLTNIEEFTANVLDIEALTIKADVLPIDDTDFHIENGMLRLNNLEEKYVKRVGDSGEKRVYGIDPTGNYKIYEINDKYATTHEVELFISGNYKDVVGNINNGYIDGDYIENDKTAVITIIPAEGYKVPAAKEDITVTNATIDSYDSTNGQITISNATGEVSISASCIE